MAEHRRQSSGGLSSGTGRRGERRLGRAACAVALACGCAWGDSGPQVAWNAQTLRLIERDGAYGRMAAVSGRGLIFVCERERGVVWRQSRDAGATWSDARPVAAWNGGKVANPELLALADGALFCFHNRRPDEGSGRPYAVAVSRLSKDGEAWLPPEVLFEAGAEKENGCWEPAAVQLPSGEVELFFANEAPYRTSDEQEISLLRSRDGGRTWGRPESIGFRAGHRDGMPVPLALADGVAVAIEDNGLGGGVLKPAILFTAMADLWRSGAVTGDSDRRWGALAEPLAPHVYGGAPYLRQMPGGATALAFQRSDDGEMRHSRITVGVGNARARGFSGLSCPFPETPGHAQLWAALCVKDGRTLTALGTLTLNGVRGVWSIDGRLDY